MLRARDFNVRLGLAPQRIAAPKLGGGMSISRLGHYSLTAQVPENDPDSLPVIPPDARP